MGSLGGVILKKRRFPLPIVTWWYEDGLERRWSRARRTKLDGGSGAAATRADEVCGHAMMTLYSFGLSLALLVSAPWWIIRMLTTGRYRAGLAGRLGRLPAELQAIPGERDVIWVHAVSVGEVLAATELVRELRQKLPGWTIAVSTTTATGQAVAQARFPDLPVFFFPLDLRFAVRRYVHALHPRVLVLLESELWPRLLHECARAGVPVVVVNARMSDRSFRRARRFRAFWKFALAQVTAFLAQGEETADRLRQLGASADRIRVTGNLKFDLRAPAGTPMVDQLRRRLPEGARILVCGSTLEGEESILLAAWPALVQQVPRAVMVLAPRHPERFPNVERLLRDAGATVLRASDLAKTESAIRPGDIVLLDTLGDLPAVYSIASAAFVGGSLVPAGGHNPLEPARFGVPITMGRFTDNFREIIKTTQAKDAIRIVTAEHLPTALAQGLVGDPAMVAMGERGRAVFEANAGATERTVQVLLHVVQAMPARTRPA